jgi:short-subunit dehydrogenase
MTARRVVLITGASGGIGADLARVFARHGHDLALVARSRDKLESLADEIAGYGRPRPVILTLDLTKQGVAAQLATALEAEGASVGILVNNAGFGLAGEIAELDKAEQLQIIDLNIRALVEMTLFFLPSIRATRGKILNLASVVAFFPGPGMAVYYASKAFIRSFSLALSQEARRDGVTVSTLCPGLTRTGFQTRAGFSESMGLARFSGASAREVAEAGYKGLMAGKRTIVPGFGNKILVLMARLVPDSIILPIIERMQQKRRADP